MLDNKDIEYLNKLYINNHLYRSNYSYKINIKINKVCTNNYKMMLDKVYSDTNDIFLVYKLRKTIFCINVKIKSHKYVKVKKS